jgi:hypothetical protein
VSAVAVGRGVRYGGWAFLAYLYGEPAVAFAEEHLTALAGGLVLLAVLAGVGILVWRRRRPA